MFKQGQGIMFNWIFVLIAGGVILTLFISFAFQYANYSEKRDNLKVAVLINNQLEPLSTSPLYTELNPIGVEYFNTEFFCDKFSVNGFRVDMRDKLIFAPEKSTSTKLLVWIDTFKLPYKIANFIFISAPNIKYYLVGDEQFSDELIDYMPKKHDSGEPFFNFEVINNIDYNKINQDISYGKLKEVKFVLFRDKTIDESKINTNVKIVRVNVDEDFFGQANNNYFVGKQMLFGAIFSDKYECVSNRVLDRLNLVNDVYGGKVIKLWGEVRDSECNYALSKASFDKVGEYVKNKDYYGLKENAEKISKQNEALYNKGCADVY